MDRAILNPAIRPHRAGPLSRLTCTAGLGLLVGALGGCSGDVVRSLASDAGYGPRVVAAPDFVTDSRSKAQPDFMPVGVDAPKRPARAKSVTGQKALEAELESARGRNEARGRAAASAGRGAAATIKPAPAAPQ
ncbi:hypothetical protein SAMN02799622_00076 [Methylobacterium sp. UNC378MF]|uniref:hypothetical protein n=1 Tax=Methylobacterium sp. UNC378MF TaxID=1502748 RepID=UPI0008895B5C|nr:hypothetical protein [Methylobacterium sp. UNC378MF]SDA09335.1 hypothetical protein SAMN02799622_00076 [Methylobacterium sp. UNC378MF]